MGKSGTNSQSKNTDNHVEGLVVLPVLILLDASGSMFGDKMRIANAAVRDILSSLEGLFTLMVNAGVVSFSDRINTHFEFQSPAEIDWSGVEANGKSDLGAALVATEEWILKYVDSKPALFPEVILISDGSTNDLDGWEIALSRIKTTVTGRFVSFSAVFIGDDDGETFLSRFLTAANGVPGKRVFLPHEARDIVDHFLFLDQYQQKEALNG